jgi:hypothetical protein
MRYAMTIPRAMNTPYHLTSKGPTVKIIGLTIKSPAKTVLKKKNKTTAIARIIAMYIMLFDFTITPPQFTNKKL